MDKEKLKNLPEEPGIYRMLDKDGNIIYIGKSKCLKQRVATYFVDNPKWEKARKMAPFIDDVIWTVTDTHLEAMLLECESIKKIKPFFNSMMKNDSRYMYIKVSEKKNEKALKITWDREENTFGPFRSRGRIEDLLSFLPNLYPIEKGKNGEYIFQYHVFPKTMSEEEVYQNRKQLLSVFGDSAQLEFFMKNVEDLMMYEAGNERFELAGKYRNLLENLKYVHREIHLYEELSQRRILYAVPARGRYKMFLIYEGIVLYKDWVEKLTKTEKMKFIKKARKASENPETDWNNEKARKDFQDIIYREISQELEQASCRAFLDFL